LDIPPFVYIAVGFNGLADQPGTSNIWGLYRRTAAGDCRIDEALTCKFKFI